MISQDTKAKRQVTETPYSEGYSAGSSRVYESNPYSYWYQHYEYLQWNKGFYEALLEMIKEINIFNIYGY